MTLSNTTAAGAPTNIGNSQQSQIILFGATSNSHTSAVFTVDQMPFYLSAFNLGNDDIITVQQVYGSGSGVEVGPFAPVHGAVQLSQNRTKVMVDYPGRYQLLHSGSSALGTFTVTGFAASMTSDPISDIAEALSASLGKFASISRYNYINLGTVVDSVNLDFSVNRAYEFTITNFTDIEGIAMPSQPDWMFIKVIQNNAGDNLIQFADMLAPILTPGTTNVQAAQAANAATVYTFWWDGTIPILIGFSSTNGEVGR
jgi:hypothetical protein